MFLVQCCAGRIYEVTPDRSTQDLKKPPPGFDSVRGKVTIGGVPTLSTVTYYHHQCYPAYLISYRTK